MTKTPEELTEEWKAGKLEYGWYWIKHKTRGTIPDQYIPGDDWFVSNGFCITKILAPCNYGEYKAMQKELAELKEKVADPKTDLESSRWYQTVQNEDIGKLRGLLKECKEKIHQEFICSDYLSIDKFFDLLTRINAALGESEER